LLHNFSSLVKHFFGSGQIIVSLSHCLAKLNVFKHQALNGSLHGAPPLQQVLGYFLKLL
jgi:hypothetical protein